MQKVVFLKPNQPQQVKLDITDPGQNHELFVFFVGRGQDTFDLSTLSDHTLKNTESNAIVRGVLFDQAKARIEGMIRIGKQAQGSNAFLDQKVLLIGDKARADVRPGLEILTDDVKASHAASVGQIDQEQLFYLQSRGLSYQEAVNELVRGFFQHIIGKIDDQDKSFQNLIIGIKSRI